MEYVAYYMAKTPLVKCIETGCHSHTPRVSSVKKYWENVHIVHYAYIEAVNVLIMHNFSVSLFSELLT